MDWAMTIWSMLAASFAVWRVANLLFRDRSRAIGHAGLSEQPENFLGNRILDCLCWLSIWLSAQTAIWVAGGLAGLLLNWFALSMISRAFTPSPDIIAQDRMEARNGDLSCFPVERTMQVNHG